MLSTMNAEQFSNIQLNDFSLLHHAAFENNMEVVEMLKTLPYFKEIVDDNNNPVSLSIKFIKVGRMDPYNLGFCQECHRDGLIPP